MSSLPNVFRIVLGIQPAGRLCPVRGDDTFIVSYPKSGNTWVRFLVGNLLYPDTVSFENIEDIIPDVYQHSLYHFLRMKSPRILKSHERYDHRYRKTIYIIRDPRDVAVSYWHHKKKFRMMDENYPIQSFTDEFVQGKNSLYGPWSDHVSGWINASHERNGFLLLRYENLLDSPEKEIGKIITFLGLENTTKDIVRRAVENSSFENMQKLEKNQSMTWKATRNTRQDLSFVRKGQSGSWQTELPSESAMQIKETWFSLMTCLGYE